jgi:hypothetical protein
MISYDLQKGGNGQRQAGQEKQAEGQAANG